MASWKIYPLSFLHHRSISPGLSHGARVSQDDSHLELVCTDAKFDSHTLMKAVPFAQLVQVGSAKDEPNKLVLQLNESRLVSDRFVLLEFCSLKDARDLCKLVLMRLPENAKICSGSSAIVRSHRLQSPPRFR